jgi:cysteine-rich repeat protein
MRGKFQFVVSALVMSVALVGLADAKKPKPVPCQPGRYLLPASIGNLTGDAAPEIPLALQPGQSMLGSCPLTTRPFKASKKGVTTVIAKSPPGATCGPGSFKKILVKVTLPSGCQSATVKVRAKKFKLQTLQANRSFCGDGLVDAAGGEQCDGSGCPATATCDGDCTCQPIPTTTTPSTTVSTTSVTATTETPTTTTSTTTTTLVGACFDIDGHVTAQTCTTKDDCPSNPDGHSGHFACCGDGVNDFGETCDKGTANCAAGTFCPSDCTADCQSIGRCTGNNAQCLDAATDCQAGQGCCGNKTVDPGETCDDGNFVSGPGDFCPATCFIASCTAVPASSFGIHVTYTHPAGTTISGLGFFVDYPEGKITAATKGSPPFGVSVDLNDLVYAFSVEALKLGGLPATVTPVTFQTCNGAAAPTAGDFTCTVTDASDDLGNVVDPATLSCAVTIP